MALTSVSSPSCSMCACCLSRLPQRSSRLLVRLAAHSCQSRHRLVPADPVAAASPRPCSWSRFGALSARLRRIPAAPLLLPLGLGIALQDAGLLTIELPPWLLAASYAIVGWSTGLGFNRTILRHAAQSLPRVITSILVLMAVCGGLAGLLVVVGRHRSADRLSRNQSGRCRFSSDHCNGKQRRCGICDGDADHASGACSTDRPQPRRFHRQAGGRVEAEPVSSPPHYMRVPAEGPQLAFQ